MKKLLIFLLSIVCIFSFLMASACDNNEEKSVENEVLILGFNTWDDLARFDLNPTTFSGNWKLNTDPEYVFEGSASWKIYVDAALVNEPNFKMDATGVKKDITDVTEFNLWAHSDSETPFDIIITAYAGDEAVCTPKATVEKGENYLSFKLRREALVQKGQMITEYSISFSGIKGGTTLYIDDFSAKTTTAAVVFTQEVQAVIDAIANLGNDPTKEQVESAMEKYRALPTEDKVCVTNYTTLKASIQSFQISDLKAAKAEDPATWLFFGDSFGEIQVDGVSAGISSYMYSTEQKHGDDNGSLKVEFAVSSTKWLTLSTVATSVPESGYSYMEFYVYNDSDQLKAVCVGWNAPENPMRPGKSLYYMVGPRHWTRIYCPTTWLYNAGGASGGIQICGLGDLMTGESQPPEGAMYFSSFVTRNDEQIIKQSRVGEDENTLYFFDKEVGTGQVTPAVDVYIPYSSAIDFEYSTDVKFGNEEGSLAITNYEVEYPDHEAAKKGDPQIKWNTCGYEFNEGDYVAFYVYNDSDCDVVDISLGDARRQRCYKGEWTMVLWSAADVLENGWSWLIGRNYNEIDATYSRLTGTIYLSKAKVYSKDQIKDLTTISATEEYTIGHATLVGNPESIYNSYDHGNSGAFNDSSFKNPYYINGTLRWNVLGVDTPRQDYSPLVGFKFKQAYDMTNCYMYVTVKGAVEGQVYIQAFSSVGDHFGSPSGQLVQTLSDGYAIYKFDLSNNLYFLEKAVDFGAFRLAVRKVKAPVTGQVIVSDIEVKYE